MMSIELGIALIIRIFVQFICSFLLFKKWSKSTKKYLTDFPFLFGLIFTTMSFSKIFDFYLALEFEKDSSLPIFFAIMKGRYLLIALTFIELLVTILIIWFRWNKRAQIGFLSIYSALWTWVLLSTPNYDALLKFSSYLMVPVTGVLLFTFFFIYHQKRLPTFHALYVALGTLGIVISQIIRPVLTSIGDSEWGMTWLCETIDVVSWVIIFFAFIIRPNYEEKRAKNIETLKAEAV